MFVTDPFAVFMKVLVLLGAAVGLVMSIDYNRREGIARFEFPVLILFATLGMMMMVSAGDLIALYVGLELQSLSLYVVAAFRRDSVKLDRGGAQILRPRRALLGHAALRRLADLRLRRHHRFDAIAEGLGGERGRAADRRDRSASSSSPPASPSRSPRRRSTCGRPTSTRARRRRSPRSSRSRPRSRRSRCSCAVMIEPFGPLLGDWRQIVVLRRDRVDAARRLRRDLADQYQAADGLQLDRPCRLRADRPRRRRRSAGIRGVADLHGDLPVHERRRPSPSSCRMRREGRMVEAIADLAGLARTQPRLAAGARDLSCSRWPASRRSPASSRKLYVFLAAIEAELYALAVIGVLAERRRRLLLPAHRQAHVLRRAGARRSTGRWRRALGGARWRHGASRCSSSCAGAAGRRARRRGGALRG